MSETMRFAVSRGVLLCVHTDEDPHDDEWQRYIEVSARAVGELRACIIVSDGGGPNPSQRTRITEIPGARDLPTVVVTPSVMVRGIVTALAWIGKRISAFAPGEISRALEFLGLPAAEWPETILELATMKANLYGHATADGAPAEPVQGSSSHAVDVLAAPAERLRSGAEGSSRAG